MASNKNMATTGRFPNQIGLHFIETFLPYVLGKTPHNLFGKKVKMPRKKGTKVKWSRLSPPLPQTTPMAEDVDPTPILPTRTDLEVAVKEYGARMRQSEWLDMTQVNQENAEFMKWLMDTYALTIDELTKQMLATSATTQTCASGADFATQINATDLDTVVQTLMNQNAEPITKMITPSTGVGTTPVMPGYVAIVNSELWTTLKGLAGWRDPKNYGDRTNLYDGEIGAIDRVRFIATTRGYKSGTTYRIPIQGMDAFGTVKIPGGEKVLGFKNAEQAGSEMDRYSVAYWKTNYASRILDDLNIVTLICTSE